MTSSQPPSPSGGSRRESRDRTRAHHSQSPQRAQRETLRGSGPGSDRTLRDRLDPTLRDSDGGPIGGGRRLPQPGETFAGCKIEDRIGRGAMGVVYRARDATGRAVALKVILAEQADDEGFARFVREGQAMAAIPRHPSVVTIHSAGETGGLPYLVMDYVQGATLKDLLKRGPLPVEDARRIARRLAAALAHIHQAGVVHRDLKPANVLIREEDGEPLLTDFGLARLQGAARLTLSGDVLGTPIYMSPEQILGLKHEVDVQTDVWALGVILYEMLAGRVPFLGASLVEMSQLITVQEPIPIQRARADVDTALAIAVERALAKRKPDRFPDAATLLEALGPDAAASDSGSASRSRSRTASFSSAMLPRARRRAAIGLGAVLAVVAVVAGLLVLRARLASQQATALWAEVNGLEGEARQAMPGFLDPPPEAAALDALATRLAGLQERPQPEGVGLKLTGIDAILRRARVARAVAAKDWAGAEELAAGEPDEQTALLLRSVVATARGGAAPAGVRRLINAKDASLAEGARIILARSLAVERPKRARELLAQKVRGSVAARERAVPELFLAIGSRDVERIEALAGGLPADVRKVAYARVEAQASRAAKGKDPEAVMALFRSLGALRVGERRTSELLRAGINFARRKETAMQRLPHRSARRKKAVAELTDLIVALGESRLRAPRDRALSRLAVSLLYIYGEDLGEVPAARAMRAFVLMDILFPRGAVNSRLKSKRPLSKLPDDSVRRYLELSRDVSRRAYLHSDRLRRDLAAHLMTPGARREIGPQHRAHGLAVGSLFRGHDLPTQRTLIMEAYRLDKKSPQVRIAYATFLARQGRSEEAKAMCATLVRGGDSGNRKSDHDLVRDALYVHAYRGDEVEFKKCLERFKSRTWSKQWVRIVQREVEEILEAHRKKKDR